MPVVLVRVRCHRGHTRDIAPGEIGPNEYPMCAYCHRPMFPVSARAARQDALSPSGRRLDQAPKSTARAGDILAYRRKQGGWSMVDVAHADGEWEPRHVADLEAASSIESKMLQRYLDALAKLGRS